MPDGNDDVLVELRGPPSSQPAAAGAPAARQPQAAGQNGAAPTSGTPVVFRVRAALAKLAMCLVLIPQRCRST